ncbi:hypothetical protein B9Z55_012206 [Caenorhabditis nigoni]|uniref:ELM2 domain-containing protein n=1 Tax=Caenorhabditis nigoni TaxID=1611254 RepID=A0A2G5TW89_9PELO|nr:hypothetical protein B9Z55_012206 [Caenorhabditis nigoni]
MVFKNHAIPELRRFGTIANFNFSAAPEAEAPPQDEPPLRAPPIYINIDDDGDLIELELQDVANPEEADPEEVDPDVMILEVVVREDVVREEVVPEEVDPYEADPEEMVPEEVDPYEADPENVEPEEAVDVLMLEERPRSSSDIENIPEAPEPELVRPEAVRRYKTRSFPNPVKRSAPQAPEASAKRQRSEEPTTSLASSSEATIRLNRRSRRKIPEVVLDRGVIPPTGTIRKPFQFPPDYIPPPRPKIKNRPVIEDDQCDVAIVPDVLSPEDQAAYLDADDPEEELWTPEPGMTAGERKSIHLNYWKPIFRQFSGHIPMERALQHLMQKDYCVSEALDSVDQCLKTLPQFLKPLCVGQAVKLSKLIKDPKMDRRKIQEKVMRNYYLGEVQIYHHQFLRRFLLQAHWRRACNCDDFLVEKLDYVQRVGCSSCTKHIKKTPLDPSLLCLICQYYEKITGRRREVREVVFFKEEEEILDRWVLEERIQERTFSLEEVYKIIEKETSERQKKKDLTEEEKSMLSEDQLKLDGARIVELLKPFELKIHQCTCKKLPHIYKKVFSAKEEDRYQKSLVKHEGGQCKVAQELGVAVEVVERFVEVYPESHRIWTGSRSKKFFHLRNRILIPDLPPGIERLSEYTPGLGEPWLPTKEMMRLAVEESRKSHKDAKGSTARNSAETEQSSKSQSGVKRSRKTR